jgi:DNA uptake protein ComE-like DNA-binding protein
MKLLVWIKKQEKNNVQLRGLLLLLLLLLVIHFSLLEKKRECVVITVNPGDEFIIKTVELTAHQKITLGVPVNINMESADGLTALPGIGINLAQKIEKERIKRNGFTDINELRSIPGIGEKKFSKIAPHVRL